MKRSEIGKGLLHVIHRLEDYLNGGFSTPVPDADFSNLDRIEVKAPVEEIPVRDSIKDSSQILKRKLIDLSAEMMKCQACPLSANSRKVTGFGNPLSGIFVITDMIEDAEEKTNRPLAGETELFFSKWMQSIQLTVNDFFITPLVKCNTHGRALSRDSIEACRRHLDTQLDLIKPKVILALGDIVLSSLCRKFMDISANHGKIFYYNKIPFFAVHHPRVVLKNESLKRIVWNDLKNFISWYREH